MGLFIYTLKSLAIVIVKPFFLGVLIILSIIFYTKNRKVSKMQKMISGESVNSPLELTLSQLVLGILAGSLLGLLSSGLGIAFKQNSGIQIIFIISIVLMFIKPRFGAFAYSGSILGIFSIIYVHFINRGNINESFRIDIVALTTFIGILYIAEGILVLIDGSTGSVPVFSKVGGVVYGGYALNRYWFLPIGLLIFVTSNSVAPAVVHSVSTPSWWPILFSPSAKLLMETSIAIMMTFYGVLNYSGITFTKTKTEKQRESGVIILIYGLILCVLSQIGRFGLIGKVIVLILIPVLYEVMLNIQRRRERKRKKKFYSLPGRVCIMEVVPSSVAYKAGIRAGDIIKSINGIKVKSEKEIYIMKDYVYSEVKMTILKKHRELEITVEKDLNKGLGLLVVPVSELNKKNFADILKVKQEMMKK
ncbi:MAG: PDZ domain-containing protein [Clostridium sp.]